MRTTLNLDDDLLAQARETTGVKEKTRLLHLGLEALIEREVKRRQSAPGKTGRGRRTLLPVSQARGGLSKGFASLKDAVAAADLQADRRQLR